MPTLTVTVELPEESYRNALALPVAERERRVAALFATAPNIPVDEDSSNYPLTPEDLAAIGRGIAESDAGLGRDGDSFFAELYAERGWPLNK